MNGDQAVATNEGWACLRKTEDNYRMHFPSRSAAIAGLAGGAGQVVRYERRIERRGLEQIFEDLDVLGHLNGHLIRPDVIAQERDDLVEAEPAERAALAHALADALAGWLKQLNPAVWAIVEREEIEVLTDAKNRTA